MPFDTTCPHCGRVHDAMPDSSSGAMVRCRGCFKPFTALALASGDRVEEPQPRGGEQPAGLTPESTVPDERADFRAVVARLADLQRKCGALVKRHPELAELVPTLDVVLRDLRLGQGPRGEPLELRELALPLGSWAHRLHRLDLPALGRELQHVERTLTDLDVVRTSDRQGEPEREVGRFAAAGLRSGSAARLRKPAPPPEARRRPVALAVIGVAVLAMAVVGTLMVLRQPSPPPQLTTDPPEPSPTRVLPSPSPRPRATAVPETLGPSAPDLAGLIRDASQAQLAAQRGDLDGAIDRLDSAARVDPSRAEVRAAAQAVVDEMVSRAAREAAEGRFVEAEEQLVAAQRLSERFVLDPAPLEAHFHRLRSAERTVRVRPTERDALVAAIGRQVEVRMVDREVREGTLTAVEEGGLVLEVHDRVGAGEVAYAVRVPLAKVELLVYRYRP